MALSPQTAALHTGCAIIYSGINGLVQELAYSDLPAATRPAALPLVPSVVSIDAAGVPSYIDVSTIGPANAVQYIPQTLTPAEQLIARTNIGAAPTIAPAIGWFTPTNFTPSKFYDTNATTLQELADIVGTMIDDLRLAGVFQGNPTVPLLPLVPQTGWTTPTSMIADRALDANTTTLQELADIVATIIEDLKLAGVFQP